TGLSHGTGDKTLRTSRQAHESDAVVDGPRLDRYLYGIDPAVGWRVHASRQIRSALKVVYGKQDARRHGIFANGLAGKRAQGFHFEQEPLAAGDAGRNQPVEFAVNRPGQFSPAVAAAAGRE